MVITPQLITDTLNLLAKHAVVMRSSAKLRDGVLAVILLPPISYGNYTSQEKESGISGSTKSELPFVMVSGFTVYF